MVMFNGEGVALGTELSFWRRTCQLLAIFRCFGCRTDQHLYFWDGVFSRSLVVASVIVFTEWASVIVLTGGFALEEAFRDDR